ncbi:hypothetical protein CLV88_11984 [Shimia abyssi]|uniref:TNase-like domain-containing protein n=1 Tax=Shimia abyssi TaxID=1662395 RepID=A0A2P8F6G8_9RHOB|nr:hypothetical protein CLV88_11984 [Shimia abyssi]
MPEFSIPKDPIEGLAIAVALILLGSLVGSVLHQLRRPPQRKDNVVHFRKPVAHGGYGMSRYVPMRRRPKDPKVTLLAWMFVLVVGLFWLPTLDFDWQDHGVRYSQGKGTSEVPRTIEGHARVRDVDTVVVAGVPVRLDGVDGPELGTRTGNAAKRWMVEYLRGKTVTCKLNGERTYDRFVGRCHEGGNDIGAAAISAGHAFDCRRYSGGRYRHLETPAAKSRIPRSAYC